MMGRNMSRRRAGRTVWRVVDFIRGCRVLGWELRGCARERVFVKFVFRHVLRRCRGINRECMDLP